MPPDLNIMEWPGSCPLCWVCWLACPKVIAWHLTQNNGQGFDHSIVPYTFTQSCSHTNSLFHFFNLCSRAKISQRRKELEVYKNWSVLKPHVTSSEKCVTNRRGLIPLALFTIKLITGNSSQRTNFVCFGHPLSIVSLQNQGLLWHRGSGSWSLLGKLEEGASSCSRVWIKSANGRRTIDGKLKTLKQVPTL